MDYGQRISLKVLNIFFWFYGLSQYAPLLRIKITWERSGSVVECLTREREPQVRASPASLGCGPWARLCFTEKLLMGRKESNQTNKQNQIPYLVWTMVKGFLRRFQIFSFDFMSFPNMHHWWYGFVFLSLYLVSSHSLRIFKSVTWKKQKYFKYNNSFNARAQLLELDHTHILFSSGLFVCLFVCLFVLLLYIPSQQLWSLRDGQFT